MQPARACAPPQVVANDFVQVLYGVLLQNELHSLVPQLYKENASVVIGEQILTPKSPAFQAHVKGLAACKDWRVLNIDAAVTGDQGLLVTICAAHVGDAERTQIFHQALVLDRSDGAWRVATEIARISDKGLFEPAPVSRELDPNRSTPELASTEENAADGQQDWWPDSSEWREDTSTGQKTWHERQPQATYSVGIKTESASSATAEEIENACWDVLTKEGWGSEELEAVTIQLVAGKGEGKGGSHILISGSQCRTMGTSIREAFAPGKHALVTAEDSKKGRPYEKNNRTARGKGPRNNYNQRNGTSAWSENREWHGNGRNNWS
jgi:hypothetical protein